VESYPRWLARARSRDAPTNLVHTRGVLRRADDARVHAAAHARESRSTRSVAGNAPASRCLIHPTHRCTRTAELLSTQRDVGGITPRTENSVGERLLPMRHANYWRRSRCRRFVCLSAECNPAALGQKCLTALNHANPSRRPRAIAETAAAALVLAVPALEEVSAATSASARALACRALLAQLAGRAKTSGRP